MTDQDLGTIEKLGDSDLKLADKSEDIRGKDVIDRNGDKIGTVDALFIDTRDRKVRFIQVASGGFLGIDQKHVLIPVDAITNVGQKAVHINQTGAQVAGAPVYNPDVVPKQSYWNNLYGYYGYAPYWAPGYVYPPYPYYPGV